jgi:peptidoglycan/xylan/chitin deacetylase (PgdA/CDA1 family)
MPAWIVALLAGSGAWAAEDADPVGEIVGLYRDAIVLGAAPATGPDDRASRLGRMRSDARVQALDQLQRSLEADLAAPKTRAREVAAFLTTLERDRSLHDADKLAFLDVVAALRADLQAMAPGKRRNALLVRVTDDETALREIEARYREEVRAAGDLAGTRGMRQRRERWEAYLEAIRADRSVEALLEANAAELTDEVSDQRGWRDNALELFGTSLPAGTFVLTFDDGPDPRYTPQILDILADHDVRAVFFEVADNVARIGDEGALVETEGAALTRRVLAEGHLLGSHSWSHRNLPKTTDRELTDQLDLADRALRQIGDTDVVLFRPPYGERDGRVLEALKRRKTRAYLWNVDSRDWADPIPESVAATVRSQVQAAGRGVILMHDVHRQTVEALPLILDQLEEDGVRLVLWDGSAIVEPGGAAVAQAPEEEPPVATSLYARSWAVVVGIDAYAAWPRLSFAVRDAEGVRDALIERFGFEPERVISLFDRDATRQRILEVLGDELPARVGPDDRVFVFFAGHGATRALPGGGERGYIVPVDADRQHLQSRAVAMSQLSDIAEAMPAKHVLFVMDACYSGLALTRSGGASVTDPRRYVREVTRRRARQILTAGGADEAVADSGPGGHSIFTWNLLQGLDGPADLDGNGFITATELAGYVAPRVSAVSKQTPTFGDLVGGAGGEFVFALDGASTLLSDLSVSTPSTGGGARGAELERARQLLAATEARNAELADALARMQDEVAALRGTRGADAAPDAAGEAQLLHGYGLAMFRKGKYAEAYEAMRQAAEIDGSDVEIVNNLGYLLQKLEAHDRSLPYLQRAIALDPERAVAYLNLGDSYRALGKAAEAREAYVHYLEMVPDSPVRPRIDAWLADGAVAGGAAP